MSADAVHVDAVVLSRDAGTQAITVQTGWRAKATELFESDGRQHIGVLHMQRIVVSEIVDAMAIMWQVQPRLDQPTIRIVMAVYEAGLFQQQEPRRPYRFECKCTAPSSAATASPISAAVVDRVSLVDYRLLQLRELHHDDELDRRTAEAASSVVPRYDVPPFGFRAYAAWPGNGVLAISVTPPQLAEITRLTQLGPKALGDCNDLLRQWRALGWQLGPQAASSSSSATEQVLTALLLHGLSGLICSCVSEEPPRFDLRLVVNWVRPRFEQLHESVMRRVFTAGQHEQYHQHHQQHLASWLAKVETLLCDLSDILQSLLACDTTQQGHSELRDLVAKVSSESALVYTLGWLHGARLWDAIHDDFDDTLVARYNSLRAFRAECSSRSPVAYLHDENDEHDDRHSLLVDLLVAQAFPESTRAPRYPERGIFARTLKLLSMPIEPTSVVSPLLTYLVIELLARDNRLGDLDQYRHKLQLPENHVRLPLAYWLLDNSLVPESDWARNNVTTAVQLLLKCHKAEPSTLVCSGTTLRLLLDTLHYKQALDFLTCITPDLTDDTIHVVMHVYLKNNCPQAALQFLVCLPCGIRSYVPNTNSPSLACGLSDHMLETTNHSSAHSSSSSLRITWRVRIRLQVLDLCSSQHTNHERSCTHNHAHAHHITAKQMGLLIAQPLDDTEHECFVSFCKAQPTGDPSSIDWLVLYYLQRCDYRSAFATHEQELSDRMHRAIPSDSSRLAAYNPSIAKARTTIVDHYKALLPECYLAAGGPIATPASSVTAKSSSAAPAAAAAAARRVAVPAASVPVIGRPATLATRSQGKTRVPAATHRVFEYR